VRANFADGGVQVSDLLRLADITREQNKPADIRILQQITLFSCQHLALDIEHQHTLICCHCCLPGLSLELLLLKYVAGMTRIIADSCAIRITVYTYSL